MKKESKMGSTIKVPVKSINNYPQGKSGGGTKKISGPVDRSISGNATKSGGIFRPTKGKS
jgi:hypothetical protein